MRIEHVETYQATIFIAGDHAQALRACRSYCDEIGLCVTVEPTTYVYTGGAEAGVRIGLINYPRFPSTPKSIFDRAETLARTLLESLDQQSVSIVATGKTVWLSRRSEDLET
ncbi:hypothetical protein AB8A28_24745 [Tardiphaga sp. 71_E8_N1_1]|uniref:hypothetical protein n=1 Tax=Tardiphaga sp. 71_E8_N1_1 TaxID=3240784 RepID=UPI003F89C617